MDSLNSLAGNVFFAIFAVALGVIADHFGVIIALLFVQIAALPTLFVYIKIFKSKV